MLRLGPSKTHYKTSVKTNDSRFDACSANPPLRTKNVQDSEVSLGGFLDASWGLVLATWDPSGGPRGLETALAAVPLRILSSGHLTAQKCMFRRMDHLAA